MTQRLSDERLAELVSTVTHTMTGMRFSVVRPAPAEEPGWRAAVLPIGGGLVTVGLSSTEAGCAVLTAALFSCAAHQVEPAMVDDSLRELVNMTAGRIKAALMLDLALGLPRVVTNLDPLIALPPWRVVRLRAGDVDLNVWLSASPRIVSGAHR